MSGVTIVPANQQNPAHYLNRKFAINFNLPKLGALADPAKSFPSLGQDNALALAALALVRLETALAGQAQADNAVVAGSVAAWGTEVTAARADAVKAMAAVKAAFPTFVPATKIGAELQERAAEDLAKTKYPAPSQLSPQWFTGNSIPTASNITTTVVNNTAISKNFVTLSTAADADSDVIRVSEINGVKIDYDSEANGYSATYAFEVDGKAFTFTKATQIVSAAAQLGADTWTGTFRIGDDEGGETALKTWSIENLAA